MALRLEARLALRQQREHGQRLRMPPGFEETVHHHRAQLVRPLRGVGQLQRLVERRQHLDAGGRVHPGLVYPFEQRNPAQRLLAQFEHHPRRQLRQRRRQLFDEHQCRIGFVHPGALEEHRDVIKDRRQRRAARKSRRPGGLAEQVRSAKLRRQLRLPHGERKADLGQTEIGGFPRQWVRDRMHVAMPAQQRNRLVRAGPGQIRPHRQILPRVLLAPLNALFEIEVLLLERLEQRGRSQCRNRRRRPLQETQTAVQLVDRRAHVEPDQTFSGSAHRDPQLVDGQTARQSVNLHGRKITALLDPLQLLARVENADRMEVEPLDLRGRQRRGRQGLAFLEGHQGQPLARSQIGEQRLQVLSR